jgi:hypothetical protein
MDFLQVLDITKDHCIDFPNMPKIGLEKDTPDMALLLQSYPHNLRVLARNGAVGRG